jgi:hypothetical protein
VAKFLESGKGDEGIVELQGFIGPSEEDDERVTLYTTLELTDRILIPRDAIVHVVERDDESEPTKVYVRASAELQVVSCSVTTIRADEAAPTLWAAKAKYQIRLRPMFASSPTGGLLDTGTSLLRCKLLMTDCIQRSQGDPYTIAFCLDRYNWCVSHVPPQ